MNKTLIAVIVAAVATFGGYTWYSGQQAMVADEKAAAEAATETATEATESAPMAAIEIAKTLLTPEGFDAGEVGELIDGSSLGDVQKLALKTAGEQAASNPDLLDATLDQVKAALGM